MHIKFMLVATAITLTPIAAFAQASAGSSAGQYPTAPAAGRNDGSSDATSSTNCPAGSARSAQGTANSNNAANRSASSMGAANCDHTARGSSSMSSGSNSSTTTNGPGR